MMDVPKTVEDWSKRVAESGITGSVTMVGDGEEGRGIRQVDVGNGEVSDYRTKIPGDLLPHLSELLRERDRMVAAALKVTIEIPQPELRDSHLASLKASCLQIAIDIIRKKYEGQNNGTTAESNSTGERSDDAPSSETARTSTAPAPG